MTLLKKDKRVEKILIEELTKSKNYSFITEETGKIINKNKDVFWIIDQLMVQQIFTWNSSFCDINCTSNW